MPLKRILWPTDFFEADREALAFAGEMAKKWEGEILALHVVGDVGEEVYGEKSKGKDPSAWALWKIGKENAEKRLQQVVAEVLPGFTDCRLAVSFGDPTTRILEMIREAEIDLLVLAARREKSLLEELFLGSVSYKLVRTAPCTVIVVK